MRYCGITKPDLEIIAMAQQMSHSSGKAISLTELGTKIFGVPFAGGGSTKRLKAIVAAAGIPTRTCRPKRDYSQHQNVRKAI